MVFLGRQKHKTDQDERIKQCELNLNIQRSQKILSAKLLKMKERNNCLDKIKEEMKVKLKNERTNNRGRYLATIKNLILQAMIKLIEPELIVMCREDDKRDVEKMCADIESEYAEFMKEKTGRDEYSCKLVVSEDRFITKEQDEDCGGVILVTTNRRIVCPNMLVSRLQLAFEECLPSIRSTLFPNAKKV